MLCPACNKNETSIVSDKYEKKTNTVKRKRYCYCGHLFSTYEKFGSLRKERKVRTDTLLKNTRFIYYAAYRMAVMTDTSNKAYQTLFGLTPSSSNKAWKKALRKTSYGYYSNKGKSYITIQKKTIKHAPEHKFNIEGKKQTIRNILKQPEYWVHRSCIYRNVAVSVKVSSLKDVFKEYNLPKPFGPFEKDRFDKDIVRKEVDEYYKSVCSSIKDEEYNQDFFEKNDPFFGPNWKKDHWWYCWTEMR
jgi:hypothetical protein|tara:strand:+ start:118 stop:855 length:738 start_codon:yes stop_codon:yes gene_type:complete